MDKWLPTFGFPLFLHSDQGKEFHNTMVHNLSELLGTVKTKTTPYHPRSDGLVERFNRSLLAMLAMFVSKEHDNWDDLLPFMMLAYNTTVHTSTGFTPHWLVFGEQCNLPGNLVHRELRPDLPPRDIGDYASWIKQALYEAYDEVRAQQWRATHRQKRNYDSKAVTRTFPIGCWVLRYYPPTRKDKLCSPWIGPYKVVRAPMEWVVGIQVDADARIFYVHMDDLKRCAPPDPTPLCAHPLKLFTQKVLLLTQARYRKQFGICKMKTAYCRKTLNAALTLKVFDFTQWKHYCAPWNLIF